jgi:hypothetical protein
MEPLAENHEVPEKKPDTDEDQERRFREPLSFGMSVVGTVAAFVAGFGILPSSTSAEKVLILVTVIGVSGAIIFGIGAWRSGRRFLFMAISVGLAFTCLAALSVATQTASSAQGTPNPLSSDTSQPASGTPNDSPGTTGSTAALAGQGSPSAAPGSYLLKYRNKAFTMHGNGCQGNGVASYYAYVLFTGPEPQVTAPFYYLDLPPSGSWDMTLDCVSSPIDIEFSDQQVATASGNPDANACDTAATTDPLSAGIPVRQLLVGEHVCIISNNANELILITLRSVSESSYDTSWSATVWSLPAGS